MTALIILAAIVVVLAILAIVVYNSLVGKRNDVKNAFATIDVMLKKRYDLIPNLVATVKQFADHESDVFNKVAASHSMAYGNMSQNDKVAMDAEMQKAQRSFFAIAEQFPELKSSENFQQLQGALNETEEQLAAARRTYNAAATEFNTSIQIFPNNILAGMMGFHESALLETPAEERANVNVKDLFNN